LQDTLSSAATRERGIYDVRAIRADLERHRRGEITIGNALFNVAQFERWLALPGGAVVPPPSPVAPTLADTSAMAPVSS
jgi:hypothetical protein